jgi:hypothetical protein
MSASASRRDNTDRSLARSAWESVPQKNRPVGYGMIGRPCTAKGVLEYQESNTFLRAENAMNVQARERVCHGKKLYRPPESYNINVLSFRIRDFVIPIIESVRKPARITPYPTGRLFWGGAAQALRARLRSHRPSGTFRNRL